MEDQARQVVTELSPRDTGRLFAARPGSTAYERLVAALGVALGEWLDGARGGIPVLLGGHGREDLFADLDLSRTIGWFTTTYPFLLALPAGPGQLGQVAGDLRRVPRHGLDFAAIRYLAPEPGPLAAIPAPQVAFDFARAPAFLADRDGAGPLGAASPDAAGLDQPADVARDYAVQFLTSLHGDRLRVICRCSGDLISADRQDRLVRSYLDALARAARGETG